MRVRKASSPASKLGEVDEQAALDAEPYRGREGLRWRYNAVSRQVSVVALHACGAWWGWVDEGRRHELLELMRGTACPKCAGGDS